MSEWKEYKLGELLQTKGYIRGPFGSALKRGELFDEGIPVYEQQHAIYNRRVFRFFINEAKYEEMRRFTVQTDDIIISCSGTVGEVSIIKENDPKGIISQALLLLRVNSELILPNYLLFFLKSKNGHNAIVSCSSGSVQINIAKREVIENIPLLLPSVAEQNKIVAILSSLDDKIDLLRRENATLEAMAETLFRQWFVEDAKEDWEEKPLKEFVDIAIGRTPPRKESKWFSTNPTDIKWLSIKDMGGDAVFLFNTSEYLTKEAVKAFSIPIIPKDTVVLSFKMTVGRVGITTEDMLSNEAIAHFKFKNNTPFSKEYLYIFLKTYKYETLGSTSSIVTAINSAMIKNMGIVVPYAETMEKFRCQTQSMFDKIYDNQKQIQTLIQTRDGLLPRLMSGEEKI